MSNLRFGTCYQHTRRGDNVIPCPPEAHGYPNRETWRVNMELWSNDYDAYQELMASRHDDLYDLAEWLKDATRQRVQDNPALAVDWADAMLSMVDWFHLAESWRDSNPELIRTPEPEEEEDPEDDFRRSLAALAEALGEDGSVTAIHDHNDILDALSPVFGPITPEESK